MPPLSRATLLAHAGSHVPPPDAQPHAPPIYQTAGFEYEDAASAEAAADGRRYLYARDASPTEDALGRAIAALEGAEGTIVFGSGMGAIAAALEASLDAGGHLVTVDGLYGGTHELVTNLLPRFGVRYTLAPAPTAAAIEAAFTDETRAVYVESISNPLLRVAELDAIGALCRRRGVALLVDATFATPLLQRPLAHGATLSIHSGTKYISGHGDVMCGLVSGAQAELAKVRKLRKLHGANCDPFGAWLALRGLRTLELRLGRQMASARVIAEALSTTPGVERVYYPGLGTHPDHALAGRILDGAGGMVSFVVAGGLDGARRVYDRLGLVARAASLGDLTSLMTHPATFSHPRVPRADRERAGIVDGLLRLSVGIEDPADVLRDLRQAIAG